MISPKPLSDMCPYHFVLLVDFRYADDQSLQRRVSNREHLHKSFHSLIQVIAADVQRHQAGVRLQMDGCLRNTDRSEGIDKTRCAPFNEIVNCQLSMPNHSG